MMALRKSHHFKLHDPLDTIVDGLEIWLTSPNLEVKVVNIYRYLRGFSTILSVVGNGISEASTDATDLPGCMIPEILFIESRF